MPCCDLRPRRHVVSAHPARAQRVCRCRDVRGSATSTCRRRTPTRRFALRVNRAIEETSSSGSVGCIASTKPSFPISSASTRRIARSSGSRTTPRPRFSALRSAGWRTALLTNGDPSVQAGKVRALGLEALVDHVVYASEHAPGGKPAREPFVEVLRRLQVGPARRRDGWRRPRQRRGRRARRWESERSSSLGPGGRITRVPTPSCIC